MAVALNTLSPGSFFSITPTTPGLPVAKYLLTVVTAQQGGFVVAYSLDQHRILEVDGATLVDELAAAVASTFTYSV